MHPHRGFMECPYTKLMTSSDGRSMSTLTKNRVKAGGVEHKLSPEPGTFELGKVGVGMEHEMLIDESWSGSLHAFQLWVNLPNANKFDAPYFQNAAPSALPSVTLDGGATAKLGGQSGGPQRRCSLLATVPCLSAVSRGLHLCPFLLHSI